MKTAIKVSEEVDIWYYDEKQTFEVVWKTVIDKSEIENAHYEISRHTQAGKKYYYCSNMESAVYASSLSDDYNRSPRSMHILPKLGFERYAIVLASPEHQQVVDMFLQSINEDLDKLYTTTDHDDALEWLQQEREAVMIGR